MSNRVACLILAVVAQASGAAGQAQPAASETGSGPRLVLSQVEHDLGRLPPNDVRRTVQVTVSNPGTQPLQIRKVRASCVCMRVAVEEASIPAGGQTTLRVEINPPTVDETIEEEVLLYSNDAAKPVSKVRVVGSIGTAVRVLPQPTIPAGPVSRGALPDVQMPVVQLLAADRVSLGRVRATSSHPAIHPQLKKIEDHWYELTVTIDKTVPLGNLKESIKVETEHPNAPVVPVPVFAMIGGDLETEGRRIDFGFIKENQPTRVTFLLPVRGERDVKVLKSEIKLAVPAKLDVIQEIADTQKIIKIAVTVSAPAFTRFDGSVELHTDHPLEPLVRIPVTGGVLASHPFDRIAAEGSEEKFFSILKDALSRRERIPLDRLFSDVFGGVKDERVAALLMRALAEGDLNTRMRAVEAMGELRTPPILERLRVAMTDDQEPFVRRFALIAYAEAAGKEAFTPLIIALQDDDAWVREDAAIYLGKLGDVRAIPALKAALADPNQETAAAVQNALTSLQAIVKR
jgi:hypothetical protein